MNKSTFILTLFFSILLLKSCESQNWKVSTTSMEGTLTQGQSIRISPSVHINRNDIIVFKHIEDNKEQYWVYRVVGQSGDKLEIKNADLYINDEYIEAPTKIKFSYIVTLENNLPNDLTKGFEGEKLTDKTYMLFLTNDDKEKLTELYENVEIIRIASHRNFRNKALFLINEQNRWNVDYYGPLVIPTDNNEKLYFVLGDNRHNAKDSRYIGYIKESDIIGIVKIDE